MNRMTYRNRVRWAEDLLGLLEAPKSKGNVSFILHWMGREGTAARFNPLATSWDMEPKGSQSEDFNDAGVKNYKNREEGLPPAAYVMNLHGTMTTNKKGTFVVLSTEKSRKAEVKEQQSAFEMYKFAQQGKAKVDEQEDHVDKKYADDNEEF